MELSSSFAYSYTDNSSLVLTSNAIDTENASSIAQDELFQGYSESLLTFASATCIIFILLGVPGNLITIIALARCKKVRNATAVFIINLSLSDLLFCCFNLPLAASTFWRRLWTHGELLCRLFPLMRYGLLAVSLFTVLAITINRYVMIGHPRIYPRIYRRKYLAIMVAATWLCAFGSLIPTWRGVWGTFGLDKSIGSCSILRANGSSPKEFLFIMAFIIPCLSIVLCYARIFYIVRRTAMKSHEPILTSSSVRMIGKSNVQDGNHSERQLLEKSSKEENSENSTSISNSSNCPPQIPSQRQTSSVKIAKSNLNSVPTIIDSSEHVHTTPVQPIIEENVKKEFTLLRTTDSLKSILTNGEDKNLKQTDIDSAFEQSTSSSDNNQIYHIRTLTDSNNKLLGDYIEPSTISSIDLPSSQENAQSGNCLKKSFKESITRFTKQSMGKTSTINTSGTSVLYPGRMTQKDRRLLKMILVIFLSFLICYLPITITKIWRGMTNIHVFNIMGYLLIYFTTCINPIIYVVMSSEYRQAYRNLLLCKNPTKHFYLPQTARLRETRSKAFSQRA